MEHKQVIPQHVADWYEEHFDLTFEAEQRRAIYLTSRFGFGFWLTEDMDYNQKRAPEEVSRWVDLNKMTMIKAIIDGYVVR